MLLIIQLSATLLQSCILIVKIWNWTLKSNETQSFISNDVPNESKRTIFCFKIEILNVVQNTNYICNVTLDIDSVSVFINLVLKLKPLAKKEIPIN